MFQANPEQGSGKRLAGSSLLTPSSTEFPTSRLEMSAVADIFDRDGDGYIDYYEFVAALHPNKDAYKPLTDADKIEDEARTARNGRQTPEPQVQ